MSSRLPGPATAATTAAPAAVENAPPTSGQQSITSLTPLQQQPQQRLAPPPAYGLSVTSAVTSGATPVVSTTDDNHGARPIGDVSSTTTKHALGRHHHHAAGHMGGGGGGGVFFPGSGDRLLPTLPTPKTGSNAAAPSAGPPHAETSTTTQGLLHQLQQQPAPQHHTHSSVAAPFSAQPAASTPAAAPVSPPLLPQLRYEALDAAGLALAGSPELPFPRSARLIPLLRPGGAGVGTPRSFSEVTAASVGAWAASIPPASNSSDSRVFAAPALLTSGATPLTSAALTSDPDVEAGALMGVLGQLRRIRRTARRYGAGEIDEAQARGANRGAAK